LSFIDPHRRRNFRDQHQSATLQAMIGGGLRARPGEVSLAHHGVLFLDELPEFSGRYAPKNATLRPPMLRASMTI
jgi:magnesium chelatase family protein